ncbi:hypothetical protein ASJ83_03220 [Methanocorpusculum parvum]|uniref:Uncharacterized protein n=1 Tax=Methanocorpusculum parvum TaxID=2193 RepID=A0AAX0Q665_9EURY|nr:hypothetical protein ASJ83_03220 [Methanocorpusculum parvum]
MLGGEKRDYLTANCKSTICEQARVVDPSRRANRRFAIRQGKARGGDPIFAFRRGDALFCGKGGQGRKDLSAESVIREGVCWVWKHEIEPTAFANFQFALRLASLA